MSRNGRLAIRAGDDSGHILVMAAIGLVALIGLGGFVIDIGRVMYAQRQLQASADAAALAGAQVLPASTAVSVANTYSSLSGQKNARANVPGVTMASGYPQLKCLTSTGLPCDPPTNANAIVVKQQVVVPMLLAQVVGFTSMTVTATATASMKGGIPHPLNVIVILDTTASMNSSCSSAVTGVSSPTKLDCALAGVRALLGQMWPCDQSLSNCGSVTSGNVANPIDKIGLMVFPGLKASTALSQEYDCSNNITASEIAAYNASPQYQIVPLSSDYRTSDTSALNGSASNLVKAVDWADGNTCGSSVYGVESPGGMGTYYAGAITAAQATLTSNARAGVQNVMILLSDGDASAATGGTNQCHGAITAAGTAKTAGTWVYSIAYGASTSGGCSTDSPSITPYSTMQQIASDPAKFFNQPSGADLATIFRKIAYSLMTTRLLDDGSS